MPALLQLEDLSITYATRGGDVQAVRGVSLAIERGQTYGLVGESGCGKTSVAMAIMGYLGRNGRIDRGHVLFAGQDLAKMSEEDLRALRGRRISMVYQDPLSSLNPCLTVDEQLTEVLTVHRGYGRTEARAACLAMLERVRMPDPPVIMRRYPHQLSGGQQQRVVIAMALLANPDLLVMDEPTTGLDVTVEATVLDLVAELRRQLDTAILYISHNLGVIARVCDRVGVMYAGELMEEADVMDLFLAHRHPYTRSLLMCVPRADADRSAQRLTAIPGHVPRPAALPPGCVFEPRCGFALDECRGARPTPRAVGRGHLVRCIRWQEVAATDAGAAAAATVTGAARSPVPLLSVEDLRTYYEPGAMLARLLGGRRPVRAVDGVSVDAVSAETLSVVGESGCGKSTLARCIAGLVAPTGGRLTFGALDISDVVERRDPAVLRQIQMVFQNPDSTLNPTHRVGEAIGRALSRLGGVPRGQVREEVLQLLREVQLDETFADRLPRQLSGGQKQRVAIARALAARSQLVICDEPTSSLDVSVQAAILRLLLEIQQVRGTAMLFISHDLGVVRYLSDTIAVMYLGQVCEAGRAEELFAPPYTPTPRRSFPRFRCRIPGARGTGFAWRVRSPARRTRRRAAASTPGAPASWGRSAKRPRPPCNRRARPIGSPATSRWPSCGPIRRSSEAERRPSPPERLVQHATERRSRTGRSSRSERGLRPRFLGGHSGGSS